jgi:hypothetical protein
MLPSEIVTTLILALQMAGDRIEGARLCCYLQSVNGASIPSQIAQKIMARARTPTQHYPPCRRQHGAVWHLSYLR